MPLNKHLLKVWLLLGLAVLLLHLMLLGNLPMGLDLAADTAPVTFATRTLESPPAPTAPPKTPVAIKPPKKPPPEPPALPVPAPAAAPPAAEPSPTENTANDTNPQPPAPAPTAAAPEEAASSPAPPVVAQQAESASPPAEKPLNFITEGLPSPVKLIYRVEFNKFPFSASGALLWWQENLRYQARLSFSTWGLSRTQTSQGVIDASGLAPTRFSDKFRSEVAAHFNRERGVITFSANTPDAPLLPGAQDRLSVLVQIASLVASAPTQFSPGTTLSIQTVGPRTADLWLFTVGESEALDLPGGPQQGLKLVRNPRQTYDQKVEIWLAPGLGYLPARIRLTETNGDFIDQKWKATEAMNPLELAP
jgi:hypothetical protein